MKKNVRNALAISGLALAIGASGFTLDASAATTRNFRVQRSHQERIVRSRKVENLSIRKIVKRRTVPGVISTIGDNTLTITSGAKTYTVNLEQGARILDRKWNALEFSKLTQGDKIRAFGSLSDLTLTAKTIRDISIPAAL